MAGERIIAFVIYPGLTPLDLVGPLQVLTALERHAPQYRTTVVAAHPGPLEGDNGMRFLPDATFEDVPRPYAILVPGGGEPTLRAMADVRLRRYVRSAAESAEVVASVCTGALILGSLGLLEGRKGTTHWAFYKVLERLGARYQRQRWVEDGKFFMSAGVSAGVDAALALAARLTDEATARQVQLELQYDPQPPFGGVNWGRIGPMARLTRFVMSLRAPLIAGHARRLTRQERAETLSFAPTRTSVPGPER